MRKSEFTEKAKQEYQKIEIPEELPRRVQKAIAQGEARTRKPRHHFGRNSLILATACCAMFLVALNTNQVFAEAAANVPVLGNIARVFTFREYTQHNNIADIEVKIPAVSGTGMPSLEERVNAEIQEHIDQIVEQVQKETEGAYDDYVEEFGSVPETGHHSLDIDYEIMRSDEEILSFVITHIETMASANVKRYFYNIDMKTGNELTLEDVLGPDYKTIADESIRAQMAERVEKDGAVYFEGDMGFTGVTEDTGFYINEAGNPVICFDKYEIAPGAMGTQEFEITAAN